MRSSANTSIEARIAVEFLACSHLSRTCICSSCPKKAAFASSGRSLIASSGKFIVT